MTRARTVRITSLIVIVKHCQVVLLRLRQHPRTARPSTQACALVAVTYYFVFLPLICCTRSHPRSASHAQSVVDRTTEKRNPPTGPSTVHCYVSVARKLHSWRLTGGVPWLLKSTRKYCEFRTLITYTLV